MVWLYRPEPGSIAADPQYRRVGWWIAGYGFLLAAGLLLPTLRTSTLVFWTKTYSIAGFTIRLLLDGSLLLFLIVGAFSILLPVWKLWALHSIFQRSTSKANSGQFELLGWLGKWSMADVLVIALIVFSMKSSGVASALVLPGAYFFAAAVVVSMIATAKVKEAILRSVEKPDTIATDA